MVARNRDVDTLRMSQAICFIINLDDFGTKRVNAKNLMPQMNDRHRGCQDEWWRP